MVHLIPHITNIATLIFADAWTDGLGKVKTIYTEVAPYLIGAVWFGTGVHLWLAQHQAKQHLAGAGLASIILGAADAIANTLH